MSDLPFAAEYAKTGRASCKGCKTPIPQGSLRIAAMLQSAFFDGKQANWYHDTCFFAKQRPQSIAEVGNFSSLRYEDQEKIKKSIESCSGGVVMADTKKGKSRKRANGSLDGSAALKDFAIEYSKSSRATCKVCEIKITKGEVRICKKVYDTEIGQKFGGQPLWHHVKCFVQNRSELLFFACGDILPGFNSLTKEDKIMVKKELPSVKQEEVPIKKLKEEPVDKEKKKESDKLEKELKDQNKLYFKYRDSLKGHLSKAEMKNLLEYNKQEIPVGEDRILDLLADIMTFGALKPCSTCKTGQLILNTHGYVCSGNLTEWTKCQNVTQTPERTRFRIVSELKDNSALKKYKYKEQVRKFRDIPPPPTLIKSEKELKEPKADIPIPPLKNLEFFIYGYKTKVKEELKIKILKMGGNVVSKLNDTLAAVVAPSIEIDKMSDKMQDVQEKDIQVIEKSFFDSIDIKGSVSDTINLIGDKNIATWGGDLTARIPQDVIDGKSIQKSKSIYSKSSSGITKLKVKDGTAVDPDSELQNVAHVYKDQDNIRYTTVLGLTDIGTQRNSYYKLQLLKSDTKSKFWVFRSWGRIGTSIGGTKLESFSEVYAALNVFNDLYQEKTGHMWIDGKANSHPKIAGKMYPVEIDYSDDKAPVQLDDGNSKLALPVQGLVKIIFDVNTMKKVMLEFELDTDKMPLGNLSRKQLMSGYKVLTELQKLLETKDDEDKSIRLKIIDATNRFYTLVPHNFGVENPPLLDKEESIKTKTDMLDNLLEIEIAYTLLQSSSTEATGSPLDSHYIKLKSDIQPVPMESPEFEIMKKYVQNTHAATHSSYSLEIVHLFKVLREGEDRRYKPFKKLPNRKLLWHGSRTTNFAGILSQGLRIAPPEAPVTGYMFGKGIYFADMVSKSANYCCTSVVNPEGMLLLCEVALGNVHELYAAKNVVKPPSGYHSVKGVGATEPDPNEDHPLEDGTIVPLGKPVKNKTKSSLLYNEYIVYDVAQVHIKYLCQLKFDFKY